jgi:RNA 2',3'-cyclic 3'-phosphodiesterase
MDGLISGFSSDSGTSRPFSDGGISLLVAQRLQRHHAQVARRPQRPTDRLFLAALPDPETAARIADLARRLRIGHGLTGQPLRPEHFHVTLHHVGDDVTPPTSSLIDSVMDRLCGVAMPPLMPSFRVAFDRVGSFKNGAFVLRGDESLIGLEVLQQRVSDALDARPGAARPFTPHVTLLRDGRRIDEHEIEPIAWTVTEVVLVHSLLGRTRHHHVARLPLG